MPSLKTRRLRASDDDAEDLSVQPALLPPHKWPHKKKSREHFPARVLPSRQGLPRDNTLSSHGIRASRTLFGSRDRLIISINRGNEKKKTKGMLRPSETKGAFDTRSPSSDLKVPACQTLGRFSVNCFRPVTHTNSPSFAHGHRLLASSH